MRRIGVIIIISIDKVQTRIVRGVPHRSHERGWTIFNGGHGKWEFVVYKLLIFFIVYILIFIIVIVLFMPYGQYESVFVDCDGN